VGGVQVDGITVLTLAVTAVLMAALTLFIDKTKLGKAMRAVSEDKDAATLMGISVDRTITLTFAIGSALAAFASMFYGMTYVYIKPTTGAMPGIKAFTAAVFGGIGSVPGAMLGGILFRFVAELAGAAAQNALLVVPMALLFFLGRRFFPRYALPLAIVLGLAIAAGQGRAVGNADRRRSQAAGQVEGVAAVDGRAAGVGVGTAQGRLARPGKAHAAARPDRVGYDTAEGNVVAVGVDGAA
jgi:ABC-type branched-subunit amino acid transport system permease subunit